MCLSTVYTRIENTNKPAGVVELDVPLNDVAQKKKEEELDETEKKTKQKKKKRKVYDKTSYLVAFVYVFTHSIL